jgi:hypothetical protein
VLVIDGKNNNDNGMYIGKNNKYDAMFIGKNRSDDGMFIGRVCLSLMARTMMTNMKEIQQQ